MSDVQDIHPSTPISSLGCQFQEEQLRVKFDEGIVAAITGMQSSFVRKVLGVTNKLISLREVLLLLEQDAYAETFVPRSRIPAYLLSYGNPEYPQIHITWRQSRWNGLSFNQRLLCLIL